ncbi:galactosyltransferase-related protein [uncultured Marivita sp.]|uniref:glycosyltransferase family 2 protein n=1 Tax=uncultured Marivita sp. TaxID=888080 RepID=UPI00261158D4|nr:galactosyltransferase-related protein [uncultured Marivita sp.]
MTTPWVSALTIGKGRDAHLKNLIKGFCEQTRLPDELIIGVMDNVPYADLPDAPFPILQVGVSGDDLPLAAARNRVADTAQGDHLLFVDIDCIPNPQFVADCIDHLSAEAGLMMGEVVYLPKGATAGELDFPRFDALGKQHPDRQGPPPQGRRRCNDYRCFWSLNFAMSKADWRASGGFDTRYVGYGGEDTDFGRTLDAKQIPIWWAKGAKVYHQYHTHAMPPVHHIHSVLRNAEMFADKWGRRTMEHWLRAFRLMGLIEDTDTGLQIVRQPGEADFALCAQQSDEPFATTRRTLDTLEHGDWRVADRKRGQDASWAAE